MKLKSFHSTTMFFPASQVGYKFDPIQITIILEPRCVSPKSSIVSSFIHTKSKFFGYKVSHIMHLCKFTPASAKRYFSEITLRPHSHCHKYQKLVKTANHESFHCYGLVYRFVAWRPVDTARKYTLGTRLIKYDAVQKKE